MMEFQQFNAIWDKKMEEFEMNAKQLTENMRKKHANELFRFKDKLQKSMVEWGLLIYWDFIIGSRELV